MGESMKEHLKEYNEICSRIRELSYKLEVVKHNIYDVKGVSYDLQVRSTAPRSIIDKLTSKDDLEAQINELKAEKKVLYDKHIQEIALVDDERKRSILRSYYLLKMSIDDIATMLDITNNRVYILKNEAVQEFKEKNKIE